MDFKRALVAASLSLAVIFVWQWIFPPQPPVRPGSEAAIEAEAVAEAASAPDAGGQSSFLAAGRTAESAGEEAGSVGPESRSERDSVDGELASGNDASGAEAVAEAESLGSAPEGAELIVGEFDESFTLESDRVRATFRSKGAQLVSYELLQHREAGGSLVDLVMLRGEDSAYPFGLIDPATGVDHPLQDAIFVGAKETDEAGHPTVVFEYRGPLGAARKRFGLGNNGGLQVDIEAAGRWATRVGPGARRLAEGVTETRLEQRRALWRRDGDVDDEDAARLKEVVRLGGSGLDWVGVSDNYFLVGFLPQEGVREVVLHPVVHTSEGGRRIAAGEEVDKELRREVEIVVEPEREVLRGIAYLGTKDFDDLVAMPRELVGAAAQTGFLGALARPLQVALRWIYDNMVQNYGWAIVLLTLLIKIILFPLTQKSMVSMARMQELNPKIQSIRSKYRSKLKDKQGRPNSAAQREMNEEIMGLYKKEGVNPASGCLPMLVQLPIFFALFRLLGSAIELRNAPWIFWIDDLSVPDPVWVLPILMGASQLLQQKLTPMSGDPMQKRIMTFMPIMFAVFAFGFPAGLVLYWLTSNLLTIVQNWLYQRWKEARAATA